MIIFRSAAFYLALLGIGLALYIVSSLSLTEAPTEREYLPASNPYEKTIAASGIVESIDRDVAIGAPISGLVTEVYVLVGDRVEKEAPLFQIDPRELLAQLKLQRAEVAVAEAKLKQVQDQLARLKKITDPRAVSKDMIETRENDVAIAQAQLHSKVSEVNKTQTLLDRLQVRAPKDGEILQNNIRVGEFYQAAADRPAMILGEVDRLQVRVDIDEQNASKFKSEEQATAYPKNNSKLAIPLTFERIEPYVIPKKSLTGSSSERVDTRVLQVIYSFEKPENFKVYVGQQVDVFIENPS